MSSTNGTKQCYYPGGKPDNDSSPCHPDRAQSTCCLNTDFCMTSNYCYGVTGTIYRASCTDATYRSAECPSLCLDRSDTGGNNVMYLCQRVPGGTHRYCCEDSRQNASCCSGPTFPFFPGSVIGATLDLANLSSPFYVKPSLNASSNSTCSSSSCAAANEASEAATKVAAGVGSALGVALLISVGFALWERRKRKLVEKRKVEFENAARFPSGSVGGHTGIGADEKRGFKNYELHNSTMPQEIGEGQVQELAAH